MHQTMVLKGMLMVKQDQDLHLSDKDRLNQTDQMPKMHKETILLLQLMLEGKVQQPIKQKKPVEAQLISARKEPNNNITVLDIKQEMMEQKVKHQQETMTPQLKRQEMNRVLLLLDTIY